MHLEQDYALRTIWDVIGTIAGTDPAQKDDWVVAGNHRDAWVYGAVDPNSGTAAMLETVHGLGDLLKQGWKPKRTNRHRLAGTPKKKASWAPPSGPSSTQTSSPTPSPTSTPTSASPAPTSTPPPFPRSSNSSARSPRKSPAPKAAPSTTSGRRPRKPPANSRRRRHHGGPSRFNAHVENDVHVGDLGSGSDYTPFIQHLGVPSTDIGSEGPYGVYHSVFDNYNWFIKFADPTFVYEQQQARVFGLEILHMADADVLPYDYDLYGKEIVSYLDAAQKRATKADLNLDFTAALAAAQRFAAAGTAIRARQSAPPANPAALNQALAPPKTLSSTQPACPTAPGTSTPSTPPASSPATPP